MDLFFISESLDREELTFQEIIKIYDHEVVSNVFQTNGKGGRFAIIVDKQIGGTELN